MQEIPLTPQSSNHFSSKQYAMIFSAYAVCVVVFGWVQRGFNLDYWLQVTTYTFLLGISLGALVFVADELIYAYWSRPNEKISMEIKDLVGKKNYRRALILMFTRQYEMKALAVSNVLFMAAWVFLALFLITSSYSGLAKGLILGIGLNLTIQIADNWFYPAHLKERFFWPIKRPITNEEMRSVMYLFLIAFAGVSLLAI